MKLVHVDAIFPGQPAPVTTLHRNGFDPNNLQSMHRTYTDPVGLSVILQGHRT